MLIGSTATLRATGAVYIDLHPALRFGGLLTKIDQSAEKLTAVASTKQFLDSAALRIGAGETLADYRQRAATVLGRLETVSATIKRDALLSLLEVSQSDWESRCVRQAVFEYFSDWPDALDDSDMQMAFVDRVVRDSLVLGTRPKRSLESVGAGEILLLLARFKTSNHPVVLAILEPLLADLEQAPIGYLNSISAYLKAVRMKHSALLNGSEKFIGCMAILDSRLNLPAAPVDRFEQWTREQTRAYEVFFPVGIS